MAISEKFGNRDNSPTATPRQAYFDLLLVSFVILFFELSCIRWFGAMVIFLTFFTNIVLIACFLGMSVGCLAASRKHDYIRSVIPLAVVSTLLACVILKGYGMFSHIVVDVGNQPSPQLIYFGTETRLLDPSRLIVPIWAISGIFFALIALMFVGLGQVMGRAFNVIPGRIAAYSINIFGSLLGIVAFFGISWFQFPPLVWFAIFLVTCLYFVKRRIAVQILGAILVLFFVSLGMFRFSHTKDVREFWSPYYKISYLPQEGEISTNNIQHQAMISISQSGPGYALPYLLNRDAGRKPFKEVLIIGAGTGNDVAAALEYGGKNIHIDAVEIDPVILSIGRSAHPERPYDDKRVTCYLDDGRSFLKRHTGKKYDLIIYALVDSLVLHSGYSSLRLESFLFTEEAFKDIRKLLQPNGIFAMYNYYRQGWVVGRLVKMAEDTFKTEPIVISIPYQPSIEPLQRTNFFTLLLVGNSENNRTVNLIRDKFRRDVSFWINQRPELNNDINAYGIKPPGIPGGDTREWLKISPALIDTANIKLIPHDNWPFLYLRDKAIPFSPSVEGLIMIAVLSLIILYAFAPVRFIRPNGQMFFLGAGFMLMETKGVVHMALLFGSTWVVNSVVFAAILVMILLANLYVHVTKPRNPWPYYVLLFIALMVNTFVPMTYFLSLADNIRPIVSCAVVFIPLFFAGVVFAMAFRNSRHPDSDIGSNIGGVILGGLSEYFSLVIGFNYLVLIALAFYVLSATLRPRFAIK